ncbi:hypothetical protein F0562_019864 [Nyssa sinensis]|uniref:ADF-H domain-containing protein n=1 Tax=Nyssa sinensis TaxID=561372 RepID=A0A5J5BTD9_9ASTE|nr:hypothetical protein F0562_019864 [Nyssa sinensis]
MKPIHSLQFCILKLQSTTILHIDNFNQVINNQNSQPSPGSIETVKPLEKTGGPAESYDDFAAYLPENDCQYAVYDFDFVTFENCQKSKIFFIACAAAAYLNVIV